MRYFPNLRAAVNLMVENLRRDAALSTSSADTAVSGNETGRAIYFDLNF